MKNINNVKVIHDCIIYCYIQLILPFFPKKNVVYNRRRLSKLQIGLRPTSLTVGHGLNSTRSSLCFGVLFLRNKFQLNKKWFYYEISASILHINSIVVISSTLLIITLTLFPPFHHDHDKNVQA